MKYTAHSKQAFFARTHIWRVLSAGEGKMPKIGFVSDCQKWRFSSSLSSVLPASLFCSWEPPLRYWNHPSLNYRIKSGATEFVRNRTAELVLIQGSNERSEQGTFDIEMTEYHTLSLIRGPCGKKINIRNRSTNEHGTASSLKDQAFSARLSYNVQS